MNNGLVTRNEPDLPPILAGRLTSAVRERAQQFFSCVASLFESWVTRRQSADTQRAYREDVMSFVRFLGVKWPGQAAALLSVSVKDVLAFRDQLVSQDAAPKTVNRRVSSLSSFYKYLAAAAAEIRLPITVPNPGARAVHLPRVNRPTRRKAGTVGHERAPADRLPAAESVIDYCDRAILKWPEPLGRDYLFTCFLHPGLRRANAPAKAMPR